MNSLRSQAAVAAIAVIAGIYPAAVSAADIVTVTHTGKIISAFDINGLFGLNDQSAIGQSYVVTYTYDISNMMLSYSDGIYQSDERYTGFDPGNYVSISINGTTNTYNGDDISYVGRNIVYTDEFNGTRTFDYMSGMGDSLVQSTWNTPYQIYSSLDVTTPMAYTLPAGVNYGLTYFFVGPSTNFVGLDAKIWANGAEEPASAAAVPEPTSWAIMLVGFGMMGGALRRQRMSVHFR